MSRKEPLFQALPKDIERYILEITGGLEHPEKIKVLKDDLYFHYVCNHLHNLPPYEWFQHITFEEAIEYMNLFTRCECCPDHKKRRPNTHMFMEGFVPEYPDKQFNYNKNSKCKCKCRHLSRGMCIERSDIEEEFNNWVQN